MYNKNNKIIFFLFFIAFIFAIIYKKEYNVENFKNKKKIKKNTNQENNCTLAECKKKDSTLKQNLDYSNIKVSINELRSDLIDTKNELSSEIAILRKKQNGILAFIQRVKNEIAKIKKSARKNSKGPKPKGGI